MEVKIQEVENQVSKKVVGTQVSGDTYSRLKALAQDDFMSISDYLRKIIILHLRSLDQRKETTHD